MESRHTGRRLGDRLRHGVLWIACICLAISSVATFILLIDVWWRMKHGICG